MTIEQHRSRVLACEHELLRSEYGAWSDKLKALALNKPLFEHRLDPPALRSILCANSLYRRFTGRPVSSAPDLFPIPEMPVDAFPKLGVMSWKEIPGMTFWPRGIAGAPLLRAWLSNITTRMASVLHTWVEAGVDTHFYLFPYRDLKHACELRYLVDERRFRFVAQLRPSRDERPELDPERLRHFVTHVSEELASGRYFVDIVIDGDQMHLLEINPAVR